MILMSDLKRIIKVLNEPIGIEEIVIFIIKYESRPAKQTQCDCVFPLSRMKSVISVRAKGPNV